MSDQNNSREWKFENNNWTLGVALVLIGTLFLLDSFDFLNINLTNWWAVFILIPGLNMAVGGWRKYQSDQSVRTRNTAFWGLFLIVLAVALFFNIAWSFVFPLGLITFGVYLFFFR